MKEFLVSRDTALNMMHESMVLAATVLPIDIKKRLSEYLENEKSEIARRHLNMILENCEIGEKKGRIPCPDTGYPLYYVRSGENVRIEGGISSLYELSKEAVRMATAEAYLRPNMVHPLTRKNPGTNVGHHLPAVEIRFDPDIDFLDIIAVPKGGGGEIFGTFYRMMVPADGMKGILKFILDSIKESTYAGKTCPPNVVGIGIGGTADLCMKIAKEAAMLRPIGSRHPEPEISSLEERLVQMVQDVGIGPMGMGGWSGVLDVHIEYAACHAAGLPVAFNAQCCLTRRKVARLTSDHQITFHDLPEWSYR